jgi:hypothetical protein
MNFHTEIAEIFFWDNASFRESLNDLGRRCNAFKEINGILIDEERFM